MRWGEHLLLQAGRTGDCKWNKVLSTAQAFNSCVCECGSVRGASNLLPVCPAWLRTNPPLLGASRCPWSCLQWAEPCSHSLGQR